MGHYIALAIAIAAALAGAAGLAKEIYLRVKGIRCQAEIVSSRLGERNRYIHTVKYVVDGREIITDDRAGYSQAMKNGEVRMILVSPRNTERFHYADETTPNLMLFGLLLSFAALALYRLCA